MKPLLVSSGEPAGIGPDLCLALAAYDLPLVVLGDPNVLEKRAQILNLNVRCVDYQANKPLCTTPGHLTILPITCPGPVVAGQLNPQHAAYVIKLLTNAASLCAQQDFSGLVTAPVHKANINAAGIPFTGHTEFFAEYFGVKQVVMLLASEHMKVALATTHLPLRQVADALTIPLIVNLLRQLNQSLIEDFGLPNPRIYVAGLNPHAGESGYLGREEIEIITPALTILRQEGMQLEGPLPADTLFVQKNCDAILAMYHDQGLPVLKYASFNAAVNVTLGLPIIRTSVDHGTALDLAGKNLAHSGSMLAAVRMAIEIIQHREAQKR